MNKEVPLLSVSTGRETRNWALKHTNPPEAFVLFTSCRRLQLNTFTYQSLFSHFISWFFVLNNKVARMFFFSRKPESWLCPLLWMSFSEPDCVQKSPILGILYLSACTEVKWRSGTNRCDVPVNTAERSSDINFISVSRSSTQCLWTKPLSKICHFGVVGLVQISTSPSGIYWGIGLVVLKGLID